MGKYTKTNKKEDPKKPTLKQILIIAGFLILAIGGSIFLVVNDKPKNNANNVMPYSTNTNVTGGSMEVEVIDYTNDKNTDTIITNNANPTATTVPASNAN